MGKPGFFFYTGDWLKDTRVLSAECRGCWIDSMCFLYEHGGQVVWPVTTFARFWSVEESVAARVLDELLVTGVANVEWQNDNKSLAKLSNRRIVRDAEKAKRIKELRSEAGKKGVAKRWQKWQPSSSISSSLNLNSELLRNSSASQKKSGSAEWPADWIWLKDFVQEQNLVALPVERFLDFAWWDRVSYSCGGIDKKFLETQLAKMGRWIMDNPRRVPTPNGFRRFVATWLEKAHESERRFKLAK